MLAAEMSSQVATGLASHDFRLVAVLPSQFGAICIVGQAGCDDEWARRRRRRSDARHSSQNGISP